MFSEKGLSLLGIKQGYGFFHISPYLADNILWENDIKIDNG